MVVVINGKRKLSSAIFNIKVNADLGLVYTSQGEHIPDYTVKQIIKEFDLLEYIRNDGWGFTEIPKERVCYYQAAMSLKYYEERYGIKCPYKSINNLPKVMQRGFSTWCKKNNAVY
jgi:hypothetical protein